MNKIIVIILVLALSTVQIASADTTINISSNTDNPDESAQIIELLDCLQKNHKINWEIDSKTIKTTLQFDTNNNEQITLIRPLKAPKNFPRNGASFLLLCDAIGNEILFPQSKELLAELETPIIQPVQSKNNTGFTKALPWLAVIGGIIATGYLIKNSMNKTAKPTNIIIE